MKRRTDCADAGADCDFAAESSDGVELMDAVRMHAKEKHQMDVSDGDTRGMSKEAARGRTQCA